ncbi:hypothetical protein GOP47_0001016 [Adiantum capillus-veneris]|uniref:B3 domain-containing protein n=1 Tax=Adiantum capillus-veneris TaxID=13818 RepID=A0A9D4ZTH2_ADICA|nr:hypothetical protein GOP47_0001016 [Adiantum capillus-veneris]
MSFPRAVLSPEERYRCSQLLISLANMGSPPQRQPSPPTSARQRASPRSHRVSRPPSPSSPNPPTQPSVFSHNPNPRSKGKRKVEDNITLRPRKVNIVGAEPSNNMPLIGGSQEISAHHQARAVRQMSVDAADNEQRPAAEKKKRPSRGTPIKNETRIDGHVFLTSKVVNQSDLQRVRLHLPQPAITALGEVVGVDLENGSTHKVLDANRREYTFLYSKWEKSQVFRGNGVAQFYTDNNIHATNTLHIFIDSNTHTFLILKDVSQEEGAANQDP